jgi:hypothetical protein
MRGFISLFRVFNYTPPFGSLLQPSQLLAVSYPITALDSLRSLNNKHHYKTPTDKIPWIILQERSYQCP